MNEALKDEIVSHAESLFPREACGLIYIKDGKEFYKPCNNISEPNNAFTLDPKDYFAASMLGEISCVVHSHCNEPPTPSQADLVACEASNLPWLIVSLPKKTWATCKPNGYKAPLIGRSYAHKVLDCYSLIRDWYSQERGIDLCDFEREEEFWKKGGNLYLENITNAGFYRIDESEPMIKGDVIIMQIGASVPNHGGVYLGNNIFIHHLMNRLSSRDVYGGWYQKSTRCVVRYK